MHEHVFPFLIKFRLHILSSFRAEFVRYQKCEGRGIRKNTLKH